jgi:hypothetical protein
MAAKPSRRVWVVLCLDLATRNNEQIISVAASLLQQARKAGFEPGLALGDGIVLEPPRHARTLDRLLDHLALLPTTNEPAPGSPSRLSTISLADDGFVMVCSAGGGPEAIAGQRLLVEDSTLYTHGLPQGWHPSFDKPAQEVRLKWWQKLVTAWTGGGP